MTGRQIRKMKSLAGRYLKKLRPRSEQRKKTNNGKKKRTVEVLFSTYRQTDADSSIGKARSVTLIIAPERGCVKVSRAARRAAKITALRCNN